MDKRIHYYLVVDVETANSLEQPMVYDIGGAIIDKRGRIYDSFSFTIRDIFVYERKLMQTAYYAEKIPSYVKEHHEGTRKMISFYEARKYILNKMKEYNIKDNWDIIERDIWEIITSDGNSGDKSKYDLTSINYFNSLDRIADLDLVRKYLNNKLKDEKLLTSIYKN